MENKAPRLIDANKILLKLPVLNDANGDVLVPLREVIKCINQTPTESEYKMTNAEKLAKDTNAMEYLIETMCCTRQSCIGCPVKHTKCMDGMQTREWLESDIDDTVDMS